MCFNIVAPSFVTMTSPCEVWICCNDMVELLSASAEHEHRTILSIPLGPSEVRTALPMAMIMQCRTDYVNLYNKIAHLSQPSYWRVGPPWVSPNHTNKQRHPYPRASAYLIVECGIRTADGRGFRHFAIGNALLLGCACSGAKSTRMVLASVPAGFKAFPLSIAHLSLPVVLKCGQSFRWSKTLDHDNSQVEWRLTLQDRVICLRQTPDTLYYRAVSVAKDYAADDNIHDTTLAWLKDYFQLEMDLVKLFSAVDDPVFQSALSRFEGAIRMLRQDPWETLISCAPLKFPHSFTLGSTQSV